MSLSFLSAVRRFPALLPSAKLAAAALVVMLVADPVWAQTITAPGLKGTQACVGTSEIKRFDLAEVTISGSNATFSPKNVTNLYSLLRSEVGDGGPTSFPILYTYTNAKTGQKSAAIRVTTVDSANPNFSASSEAAGYTAKTPYYFTVFARASGFGESRPLTRLCFMTGGTYTPTNTTFPGSTGCFSISPRTPQDVRNCLCGRGNTGTVGTQNYDYTSLRPAWGCAN